MKNDTINKITEFLFINVAFEKLTFYDLVIVLGNNFYEESVDILEKMLNNKNIDNNTKIILSGNKGKINDKIESTEAEIMANIIKERGLKLKIILEKKATNIRENLKFSKVISGDLKQYKQILIIGKAFASRRILMCANALDFDISKIQIYGLEIDIKKDNWYKLPETKKRVLEELERIAKYTLKNDLKL